MAWAKGGAAYLAMVSGAPVVPVAILGTREPGQTRSQLPRRRATDPPGLRRADPRAAAAVAPAQGGGRGAGPSVMRRRLADHVVAAQALTGLPLPGPPEAQADLQPIDESSEVST